MATSTEASLQPPNSCGKARTSRLTAGMSEWDNVPPNMGHATHAASKTKAGRKYNMLERTGQGVRVLRQRLGMTQEEFARRIQVTLSTVNRWENGHAAASHLAWRAIEDLAKRQGVTDELGERTALMAGAL